MPTRIRVDFTQLDRVKQLFGAQGVQTVIREASTQFAPMLWRRLVELSPTGTGQLRRSWSVTPARGWLGLLIRNAAKHAGFVEFGTRPHVITPRRKGKKFLAWRSGGRGAASAFKGGEAVRPDIFARRVNHPGTERQDITTLAWRDRAGYYGEAIARALERALQHVAR